MDDDWKVDFKFLLSRYLYTDRNIKRLIKCILFSSKKVCTIMMWNVNAREWRRDEELMIKWLFFVFCLWFLCLCFYEWNVIWYEWMNLKMKNNTLCKYQWPAPRPAFISISNIVITSWIINLIYMRQDVILWKICEYIS